MAITLIFAEALLQKPRPKMLCDGKISDFDLDRFVNQTRETMVLEFFLIYYFPIFNYTKLSLLVEKQLLQR